MRSQRDDVSVTHSGERGGRKTCQQGDDNLLVLANCRLKKSQSAFKTREANHLILVGKWLLFVFVIVVLH